MGIWSRIPKFMKNVQDNCNTHYQQRIVIFYNRMVLSHFENFQTVGAVVRAIFPNFVFRAKSGCTYM